MDSQAVISTPRQQGKEPQELVLAFTSAPVPGSQIWGSALCLSQIEVMVLGLLDPQNCI